MRACEEAGRENEGGGGTTLKKLREHKYFKALGVQELEEVMSEYEELFMGELAKETKGTSVL